MEDRMPRPGELYLHFKKKLYQIITVAKHSETQEMMVVYQALYGDYGTYVRPLDMFVSKVDTEKYPEVTQYYRFQKITRQEAEVLAAAPDQAKPEQTVSEQEVPVQADPEQTVAEQEAPAQADPEPVKSEETEQEEDANPILMKFLDADNYDEKYKILVAMRSEITDRLINDLAVVLDVVIPEGDLDERYNQLKNCVETFRKYEITRLR